MPTSTDIENRLARVDESLRRSRELGEQMSRSGEGVVRNLRRAAQSLRTHESANDRSARSSHS